MCCKNYGIPNGVKLHYDRFFAVFLYFLNGANPRYTKVSNPYTSNCFTRRKDPAISPQETVRNLEQICQAIKRTGNESKSIYLCTIPTAGDDTFLTPEQMADNLLRNQLIEAYVKK